MSTERLELSVKDRIILFNQCRILEILCPKEADDFQDMQTILERGYEREYGQINPALLESRMTAEDCGRVVDILEMYLALRNSLKVLPDKGDLTDKDLEFPGFDGNNPTGFLGYAKFLILRQNLWRELVQDRPDFDLNSHFPHDMGAYGRMLEVWKAIDVGRKYELNLEEISQILKARIHPEHR